MQRSAQQDLESLSTTPPSPLLSPPPSPRPVHLKHEIPYTSVELGSVVVSLGAQS